MKKALAATASHSSVKKAGLFTRLKDQWDLQLLAIVGVILILIFSYLPMYGLIMSFQ